MAKDRCTTVISVSIHWAGYNYQNPLFGGLYSDISDDGYNRLAVNIEYYYCSISIVAY